MPLREGLGAPALTKILNGVEGCATLSSFSFFPTYGTTEVFYLALTDVVGLLSVFASNIAGNQAESFIS